MLHATQPICTLAEEDWSSVSQWYVGCTYCSRQSGQCDYECHSNVHLFSWHKWLPFKYKSVALYFVVLSVTVFRVYCVHVMSTSWLCLSVPNIMLLTFLSISFGIKQWLLILQFITTARYWNLQRDSFHSWHRKHTPLPLQRLIG
jgi:NADH:ubiquinone oxidoreductase subunit 3 (subunit A)